MFDVVIIGGGPAGLSAALMLARARRRVLIIDSGQPRNYAARHVNGFLGSEGVSPEQLRSSGRSQCIQFGAQFLDDTVTLVRRTSEQVGPATRFQIQTAAGAQHSCRKVLFATGVCDVLPEIPGVRECYGISVHHCPYCDGWEHRDSVLASVGASVKSALALGEKLRCWSSRVIVLTNGEALDPTQADRARGLEIHVVCDEIKELAHNQGRLSEVVFEGNRRLPIDALFFSAPQRRTCLLPDELGCRIQERDRVATTDKQGTGVPGVFLAGDADGDVQFAIIAAAEGATSAVAINKELLDEETANQIQNPIEPVHAESRERVPGSA